MVERQPATDGSSDFDHLESRWVENRYPIWKQLRDTCPIVHPRRFQGVYFPSRFADVHAIAYDTEHFFSRRLVVHETHPPLTEAPPIAMSPKLPSLDHEIELRLCTPVDPLTRLMMDADGVSASELEVLVRRVSQALATRSGCHVDVGDDPPRIRCPSDVWPPIACEQS